MKKNTQPSQEIKSVAGSTNDTFVSEDELQETLANDQNENHVKFKGKVLAPYNYTYHQLGISASKSTDSNSFFCFLIIYCMLRGEEIYQAALIKYNGGIEAAEDEIDLVLPQEVEDDLEGFRAAVRKWSRHFINKDADVASALLLSMRNKAERSEIVSNPQSTGTDNAGK